ncbi:AfsR/SARP family transcriptional regulator [Nocardia huaxiensis]|uniref:AfsR family transcriptional regulator n=1 Tax=Nocardia huaxiensis TaxID=2755382 RepID=A0A7D6VAL3_9NOCA|nr:AfsR/SARP family transcriptional regulator [Nocardia huaxiensis]QLY29662.1 AfsR family transcriptional regulator [Nocardia huaxiensis]UFS96764.1 NB-ARC domain-containing protein [Nocardia huaxiensis]
MAWQLAVLGPVELMSDGAPTPPMPPKQRAALVMLAFARGRTVSVDELAEGIWGAQRPSSAVGALRNYAWALRKHLSVRPGSVLLSSESRGYRLDGPLELDADRIESLRAEADHARAGGHLEHAEASVRAALLLWRGDPLTGVPGPWAAAERARLRRLRRVLQEDLADIAVQRGDYQSAIADLVALISGDPLGERLRGLLMTALYRAGRRTEALEEYQRIRRLLVAEQGIEPGPALLELHRQILSDELPPADADAAPDRTIILKPAQLLPDTADFTGRQELVRDLCAELGGAGGTVSSGASGEDGVRAGAIAPAVTSGMGVVGRKALVAISGMGGVGKTALALHVAHRIREDYPDGQLYVDLHGAGSEPAHPGQVLGAFLRALGVPQRQVPVGVDERAALFRSTVSGRRLLLLLDNARDAAQVVPLLPGEPRCAVLVTARRPLTALPGVHSAALRVLETGEAVELFSRIVGQQRVAAEPEATRRIVELCGLLPMAVRIVAARVAARPQWTIVSEAERLAVERHDLDRFRAGELALTAAFRAGYEQLAPAAARTFRMLAVAELPDLPLAATAAVLDTIESVAEDLCEELVDRGMLETVGRGRYHYHDLMRLFALSRAGDDGDVDVTARLLDYYLATMKTVLRVRHPGLRLRLAPTGHPGTRLADLDATRDFLTVERRNLVALYRLAVAGTAHHRTLAADLALAVGETMLASDATVDIEKALEELIRATEADGNAIATQRARLALVFVQVAEFNDPVRGAEHVRRLLADVDPDTEPWVAGTTNVFAGIVDLFQQEPARASAHFADSLRLFRNGSSPECVRVAYSFLAQAYSAAGRNRDSLAAAARAVVGDSHPGTRRNIMWALTEAAWVMSREGEGELGSHLFDAALHAARRAGSTRFESAVHARAALAHLNAGRLSQAAEQAERAEATRDSGRMGIVHTYNLLVRYTALRNLGRNVDAAECYRAACTQIPDFDAALTRWTALMASRPALELEAAR